MRISLFLNRQKKIKKMLTQIDFSTNTADFENFRESSKHSGCHNLSILYYVKCIKTKLTSYLKLPITINTYNSNKINKNIK